MDPFCVQTVLHFDIRDIVTILIRTHQYSESVLNGRRPSLDALLYARGNFYFPNFNIPADVNGFILAYRLDQKVDF